MRLDPFVQFQRHLNAQGKRPGTQDVYLSILARFLRVTPVPESAITVNHVYDFLIERGNELGRSASWFNVTFHAMVAWMTMREMPTQLRGLRPKPEKESRHTKPEKESRHTEKESRRERK